MGIFGRGKGGRGCRTCRWRASGVVAAALLAGCTVLPVAMDDAERERLAAEARDKLFAGQEPLSGTLSLAEATARAVKYHADQRLRLMEEAVAAAQLDVARFDLLPRLTANAGYTTRNNDAFGFGFTPGGGVAVNPSASVERSRDTFNLGFAWNVLDFGVSYYRARQLADQTLIARERRRKAVQTLMHDVRQAWWRAEAAQRLTPEIDSLLDEMARAMDKTRAIEARKLLPPAQVITLRRALLDLEQQISARRQDLAQAQVELAALVNVPPGTALRLGTHDLAERRTLDLTADVDRLESAALRSRPELAEEGYRARITEAEARKAILGILPGLTLDFAWNYDSNRYLVNNAWTSAGMSLAFNLVKVFSIPALNRSAEAQRQADEARRMAMAMAIMAQTRIAAVRYALVADEYAIWNEAARDDEQIVKFLSSSAEVGIDTELEIIRAKARSLVSKISRDLTYANLESAVGRLYNSVGFDPVKPDSGQQAGVAELTAMIEARFSDLGRDLFTQRPQAPLPTVWVAPVEGVDSRSATLLSEGIGRALGGSEVRMAGSGDADLSVSIRAHIQPPRRGGRATRLDVRVLDRRTGREVTRAEFRTTLSEPVDDEQLRVLGEGAAYRVLGTLAPSRIVRFARPAAGGAERPASSERRTADVDSSLARFLDSDGGTPLHLRIDPELRSDIRAALSRAEGPTFTRQQTTETSR